MEKINILAKCNIMNKIQSHLKVKHALEMLQNINGKRISVSAVGHLLKAM